MTLHSSLAEELETFQGKGFARRLRTLERISATQAILNEKKILLFCGNDYLGLSQDPRVIQAGVQALKQYGAGSGAARLISGTSPLHTRLEGELAQFKKKEAGLIFGAGYLANVGTLSALAGEGDLVVMDKLCHASLIDGAKLSGAAIRVFPHKNYKRCAEILGRSSEYRKRILVSDSVFSMDGDLADLAELARLREKHDCLLVVDDAHGIGVFGEKGRGATEGFEDRIDCILGTLSKALGVFGGFAAGSKALVEHLIHFSRAFIFATAPPPSLLAASLEALRMIQEETGLRKKLWENVNRVQQFLNRDRGTAPSPIFPIRIGDEKKAVEISEKLLERGILIPAIRYPTVSIGKARLRLTLSAAHTEEELARLFEALNEVLG